MYSEENLAIHIRNLSKSYQIYETPGDRLKQMVVPSIRKCASTIGSVFGLQGETNNADYFREFWALREVSLQIRKGESIGIIGGNGAGKSTLLQLVCGTLNPTKGDVIINGRISALLELGSGFNPEFTGRENVFLYAQILGLSRREIDARFDSIAAFADIGEFLNQKIKTYSSGMIVRLAFAVAVSVDPEILVIDEALAVGDMPFQAKCFDRLRKLREREVTLLFVSHNLGSVRSFCDKVVYLEKGKIKSTGTSNDVCRQYELDCIKQERSPAQRPTSRRENSVTPFPPEAPLAVLSSLENFRPTFAETSRMGSGAVIAESFVIVGDDGQPITWIQPTQHVTAHVLLRFNCSIERDLHVSLQIHAIDGTPLMIVRDSAFEELVKGDAGHAIIASMRFSLPLRSGNYYARLGVLLLPPGEKYSDGRFNFEKSELTDVIEQAAYFSILPFDRHPISLPLLQEAEMQVSAVRSQ